MLSTKKVILEETRSLLKNYFLKLTIHLILQKKKKSNIKFFSNFLKINLKQVIYMPITCQNLTSINNFKD